MAGRPWWDHSTWKLKVFPNRQELDRLFPDRPVVLIRLNGMLLLANEEAIRRSGIIGSQSLHLER